VYTAAYEFCRQGEQFEMVTVIPQAPEDIHDIVEKLNALDREVIFLGDGVPVYLETVRKDIRVPFAVAPAGSNRQRAASIASLGAVYFAKGKTVTAAEHQPEYLRKSQAEREQEERACHAGDGEGIA
jgi:tRNA threonylcarbamoyladenosine biosynthesis protein TsaB